MAWWAALVSALQNDKSGGGGGGSQIQMPQRSPQSGGGPTPQAQGRGLSRLAQSFQAPRSAVSGTAGPIPTQGSLGLSPSRQIALPQDKPLAKSSDFWENFGINIRKGADMFKDVSGGIAATGAVNNLYAPSRATNRWQPNTNPGIAGLREMLRASHRGGYGR